jgi:hypothetical protein
LPVVQSVFYHPQLLGWFCGLTALLFYARYGVRGGSRALLGGAAFTVGVVLSARRRAIAATIGALAAGMILARSRASRATSVGSRSAGNRWKLAWLVVAGILMLFAPVLVSLAELTTGTTLADEAPARLALYTGALQIAHDSLPFGVGFGRYASWISRTNYSDVYDQLNLSNIYGLSREHPEFITDTFWPQVLGETGLAGLLGYGLFLWSLGRQLVVSALRTSPRTAPVLLELRMGMAMILVQTLIESLASAVFNSPSQVIPLMLGFAVVLNTASLWPASWPRTKRLELDGLETRSRNPGPSGSP